MANELPLHMYIRPLTLEDVEGVVDLESIGFPPTERCNEDVLKFRINACPELCSGLFIREVGTQPHNSVDKEGDDTMTGGGYTSNDSSYQEAGAPIILGEKLIGHILATKIPSTTEYITFDSMKNVHDESSNFIGVHSLVIDPHYQKKNLATLLMTDYIQKLSNQEVGTKIVIIAHEHLFPFYERLGFKKIGPNENVNKDAEFSKHGIWYDMERDLVKDEFDE